MNGYPYDITNKKNYEQHNTVLWKLPASGARRRAEPAQQKAAYKIKTARRMKYAPPMEDMEPEKSSIGGAYRSPVKGTHH